MRVYIASKYIAHKELNRKIYEELVRAKIPVFLPECINMDAIDLNRSYIVAEKCFAEIEKCNVILAVCPFGKSVSSELGYAIALRRALKQEKVIIALYLDFEKEAMLIPYVDIIDQNQIEYKSMYRIFKEIGSIIPPLFNLEWGNQECLLLFYIKTAI